MIEWDRTRGGPQWNLDQEWRRTLVGDLIPSNAGTDPVTIVVGPATAAGRRTQQASSTRLILMDLVDANCLTLVDLVRALGSRELLRASSPSRRL
jgi:hypothetical protein